MRPATLHELTGRLGVPVPPPLDLLTVCTWADFQDRYDAARSVIRTAAAALDDAADGWRPGSR